MPRRRIAIALATGLLTGIFSGLLGIGGGLIIVATMVAWLHTSQHEAHGSSLVAVIPIALVGALLLGRHAFVNWPLAAVMGGASIIGAPVGARLAHAAPGPVLRRIVGLVALLVAAAMLGQVFGWI